MTAFKVHRKWHFRGDSKQNPAEGDANSREGLTNSSSNNNQLTLSSHPHLQGLQAVGLMPNPRPHAKSQKRKLELKCEYCPSTFISNNNLRRHIYELHKDVITNMPAPPEIPLDRYLHCRRCELKFETKQEWIAHKVSEARLMKPYGPFQWGCDLCGADVSRKEKLVNHIHNHMKDGNKIVMPHDQKTSVKSADEASPSKSDEQKKQQQKPKLKIKQEHMLTRRAAELRAEESADEPEETEDATSVISGKGAYGEGVVDGEDDYEAVDAEMDYDEVEDDDEGEDADGSSEDTAVDNENDNANDGQTANSDDDDEEEEEEEDDEDEEVESEDTTNQSNAKTSRQMRLNNHKHAESEAEEDDEDNEQNIVEEEEDLEDNSVSSMEEVQKSAATKSRFSCDLCQVYFDSQPELQQHVKMHFLNGPGSVTLTGMASKPKHNNKGNSSNDIVTVNSS